MFKGFNFLTPIALSSLIQVAATVLLTVLFFFGLIPQFIELLRLSQGTGAYSNRDEIEIVLQSFLNMKTLLLFLGYMLSLLFITALWVFKNHFIVIYNMQAWPALELSRKVVTKNLLPVVGLLFLLFVILIVSAIPCGIGLLFTLPLSIGATYSAFAQITGADHANEIDNNMFDFIEDEPKV